MREASTTRVGASRGRRHGTSWPDPSCWATCFSLGTLICCAAAMGRLVRYNGWVSRRRESVHAPRDGSLLDMPRSRRFARGRFPLERDREVAFAQRGNFTSREGRTTAHPSGHCVAAAPGIAAPGEPSASMMRARGAGSSPTSNDDVSGAGSTANSVAGSGHAPLARPDRLSLAHAAVNVSGAPADLNRRRRGGRHHVNDAGKPRSLSCISRSRERRDCCRMNVVQQQDSLAARPRAGSWRGGRSRSP